MPDSGSVQGGEPHAKASRSPVKHRHCDDIWQTAESAEEQAALCVQLLIGEVGWDGRGVRYCRLVGRGGVLSHHVWELAM